MTLEEQAFYFMKEAHKGQMRWDNITPYETHPIKVVAILKQFGVMNDHILSAAYLHDVLEDTTIEEDEIRKLFGDVVLAIVKQLTFNSIMTDEKYIATCKTLSDEAKIIKIADILANLTDADVSEHFIRKRLSALKAMINIGPNL